MKKFLLIIISVICVLPAQAQRRSYHNPGPRHHHRHYHHNSTLDDIGRTLDVINDVATTAILFAGISRLDDYTGIRMGGNVGTFNFDDSNFSAATPDNLGGFNAGIVFGWYLGKSNFIIEPGAYFTTIGSRVYENLPGAHSSLPSKVRMYMVEIPVVVKYDICLDQQISLQPFGGMFMSFGVGGDSKFAGDYDSYDTFCCDAGFRDFDAGFRFGLGLSVNHFYIEAAYDLGLVNLNDHCYDSYICNYWPDNIHSRTVQFNVGFNF